MDIKQFIDICGLRPCYKYQSYMDLFPKKTYEYFSKKESDNLTKKSNNEKKYKNDYNDENIIDILVDKYYDIINHRYIITDIESEESSEDENEFYYYNN